MKKTRHIKKFTIETERTFIFRNLGGPRPRWCQRCGAETLMASVPDARREAGLSELASYQLLDDGGPHFIEDTEGRVLICLNSLMK